MLKRKKQVTLIDHSGLPRCSVVKGLPTNVGDVGSVPLSGKIPWRRRWPLSPVFLPAEFHGQRSLAGCSLWSYKRVDHDLGTKQEKLSFHCQCRRRHHLWCCRCSGFFLYAKCPSECPASIVSSNPYIILLTGALIRLLLWNEKLSVYYVDHSHGEVN